MQSLGLLLLLSSLIYMASIGGCQPSTYDPAASRQEVLDILDRSIAREQAEANQRRQAYVESHPGLSERVRNLILSGSVANGMTDEQVVASWGEPVRRNISSGGREQWVYGTGTYLYFRSGLDALVLESWQVSR